MKTNHKSLSTNRIPIHKDSLSFNNHNQQQTINKNQTHKKNVKRQKQKHMPLTNVRNNGKGEGERDEYDYRQNQNYNPNNCNNYYFNDKNNQGKYSPYVNLPSMASGSKVNNGMSNHSNVSQKERQNDNESSQSIYHQFSMGSGCKKKHFQTQESQEQSHRDRKQMFGDYHNENEMIYRKDSRNFNVNPTKRQKCHHHSVKNHDKYNNNEAVSHNEYEFMKIKNKNIPQKIGLLTPHNHDYTQNNYTSTRQVPKQVIQRQISQKLDRVCQRIQNLSRSKQKHHQLIKNQSNQSNTFLKNNMKQTSRKFSYHSQNNLIRQNQCNKQNAYSMKDFDCKSTSQQYLISNFNQSKNEKNQQYGKFYNISISKPPQNSTSKQLITYDNYIQHKIVQPSTNIPSQSNHQLFLQSHIIQLDKKLKMAYIKIAKLQENLLQEKQLLIKKQKQWLLRQNELLQQFQNEIYIQEVNIIESGYDSGVAVIQGGNQKSQKKKTPIKMDKSKLNKGSSSDIKNEKCGNTIIIMDSSDLSAKRQKRITEQCFKCKQNQKQIIRLEQINDKNDRVIKQLNQRNFRLKQELSRLEKFIQRVIPKSLNLLQLNVNWNNLMNRTLNQQLPGTAFRVKQQMNLNQSLFKQIQELCKYTNYKSALTSPTAQLLLLQNSLAIPLSHKNENQSNPQPHKTNLTSNNQSQVFLLDSYCPSSSKFQILQTKRNIQSRTKNCKQLSRNKRSSKKSLKTSECKQKTNKKNDKSIQKKMMECKRRLGSVQKQEKQVKQSNLLSNNSSSCQYFFNNKNIMCSQSKSSFVCEQVFYDSKATESNNINDRKGNNKNDKSYHLNSCLNLSESKLIEEEQKEKQIETNKSLKIRQQILSNNVDYYYMMELQALTIENFLNNAIGDRAN